jgi:hypothetical protein
MATLETAIHGLRHALEEEDAPHWRWALRRHLSLVREALAQDPDGSSDGWLAARAGCHDRDRHHLLARVAALGPRVLDRLESDVATDVRRLLVDLEHYQQRRHDLVYDSVALELGGSE